MKRLSKLIFSLLLVWAVVLLLCWESLANPWLVCNVPTETVISCEVEVTKAGITATQAGVCTVDGTDFKLLDLAGYGNGTYIFKARFIGTGGWPSEWSIPFDAAKPAAGSALRVKR